MYLDSTKLNQASKHTLAEEWTNCEKLLKLDKENYAALRIADIRTVR